MKKESLLKSLLVVLAMSFFSVVAFAQATTVGVYKKVTEAPANGDWSGQYLIVAEGGGSFFIQDGSTYNGTAGAGKVATWINNLCVFSEENGTIEVTQAAMDRALQDVAGMESYYANGNFHFTIDKDGHVILATGAAMGSGTSNGKIAADKTLTATNTISLRADGSAQLASKNGSTTRYLWWIISGKKFSYYSATSAGTTYYPVYLYKLVTDEGGEEGGDEEVTAPEQPTASVESGDYLEAFNLTLSCATEGATIKYTLNGGEEQTYSEAINIAATTTLVAWAEKDTLKSEEVTFTYNLPAEVANIAAFIADESGKDVRIASTMTVVFCYSSYLYVKDESGYMLVKGQVNKKNPAYKVGDQFTGLVGKAATANGMKQLTPANFPTTTATGVAVEPEVVAAADVTLAIPHKYIKLEGAKLESKSQIMLTASLSGITFNITDLALKYMNDKTIVVGDYIDLSAIVSADSKGVCLYLVSMEKVEVPETPTIPEAPAAPAIQYGGGYFVNDMLQVEVTTTETRPNYILVTIDGSEPSFEGVQAGTTIPVPSGQPIQLTDSKVIKVRGFLLTAEGQPYQTPEGAYLYSDVVTATFTKVTLPATPVFNPAAGDYYDSVTVAISCATENVMVKYEFGGTEPTGRSATYTEPFKLTATTTVSAMAFLTDAEGAPIMDVEGMPIASLAAFAEYKVTPYVAPEAPAVPTIQYGGGYFTSDMLQVVVNTTETRPTYILVTIDGSEPSFEGVMSGATLPAAPGQPIQLTATTTVKVRGLLVDSSTGQPYQNPDGTYVYSEVASATFTKVDAPAAPEFTPVAGEYTDSVVVSIACATENVMIKYEFGGTEPTGRSATYTEPFKLTATTIVSAMAFLTDAEGAPIMDVEGMPIASAAVFAEYKVKETIVVANPVFTPAAGEYLDKETLEVTLACSTPDAKIYWTYGTDASVNHYSFEYEREIPVDVKNNTISAIAIVFDDDAKVVAKSEVVYATYTLKEKEVKPIEINFTPAPGEYEGSVNVTIEYLNVPDGGMCMYSIDGTDPMREYKSTTTITLTETTTVKARVLISMSPSFQFSETVEAVYTIKPAQPEYEAPAAPVFTPEAGEYIDSVAVSMTCETENAIILYDVLGLTPNFTSPRFEGEPIIIKETTTIAAISVLVDAEGEVILDADEMPYMSEVVTVTYVVKPNGGVGVDNIELVAVVYAKGGMVYVDTELGNMIEVFTVQGQCIYSAEATAELTAIDAFNADVLLVRVNGQTIKVAIK